MVSLLIPITPLVYYMMQVAKVFLQSVLLITINMPEANEKVPFSAMSSLLIQSVDPHSIVLSVRGYLKQRSVIPFTISVTGTKDTYGNCSFSSIIYVPTFLQRFHFYCQRYTFQYVLPALLKAFVCSLTHDQAFRL